MSYWRNALGTWPLQHSQIEKLVNIILPSSDYNPCWQTIIKNDTRTWLRLRPEQTNCLKRINKENRLVVTGFPGTGKTLLLTEHARKLSDSGQKVLVITYNYLLSKQLQNELPDSGIEVRTFHEQCRRAARATGNSVPTHSSGQDSEQDWYSTDAPKVLRQGVNEKKLKDYDALIVDEGQAIHAAWWNILCEWFDKKRIIVFCDSTQSFSFENSTSSGDVATAIDAETPYVLTINLRSPRAVFDRVSEIKLAPYQQSCPRPLAVNTLTEIVVEDMQEALRQVVIQLRGNDNVPPHSIVILDATPRSQKEDRYAGIRVVSAAKFRGLEAPIVIVWAGVGSDEASLFCAYTRATSRCIAIYDAIEVLKGNYQTFGEVVLGLDKVGNIKKEAQLGLTSGIVKKQRFSLVPAAEKTVRLSWCPDWDGWVIFPEKDKQIERSMWTHHLITTTCQPVYTWNIYDRNTLCYFEPISTINDSSGRHCDLAFCEYCNTLTPFASVFGEEIGECTVCIHRQNVLTPPDINIQSEFDQILSKGSQSSNSSKRRLSIFLIALGRWNSIAEKRKKEFDNYLPVGGTVGYSVAYQQFQIPT